MDLSNLPHPEYPGHALLVALYIMRAYPSAKLALAETTHGWPDCVGCIDVPGAGDGAYAGSRLIRKIQKEPAALDAHITWSREEWKGRVGPKTGNHEYSYEPGQLQADSLEELFRAAVAHWDWSL